jgi:alpha-L-fucosidase
MIGNNHHLSPISGEDFQMFERDLPGENRSGLSFQKASHAMPLETCETTNGAWGYNITDRHFKSVTQVIRLLVGAAGRDANLLLNVGPMPNGLIQSEFTDTLAGAGKWLQQYGESIYGTRGGPLTPQDWGVTTQKGRFIYLHVFKAPDANVILLPDGKLKIKQVKVLGSNAPVTFTKMKNGVAISTEGITISDPDTIIVIEQS